MGKLIDIKSEEFWQILFDEACVEGGQAERIENELNKISTDEQEIRNKTIDEFLHNAEVKIYDRILQNQSRLEFASGLSVANRMLDEIAERMKGE